MTKLRDDISKKFAILRGKDIQETTTIQEPPWFWFTLPELGFPLLADEYRRPIHPDIEDYMRRYVSNDQDWEQVDDEDCWGVNYTGKETEARSTTQVRRRRHGCPTLREPEDTECAP